MDYYETTLGYLGYEGTSDKIRIPTRLRERHLTQMATEARLQAIGPNLQIVVWSERDNIIIKIPLHEWQMTGPYKGTLTGPKKGILAVGRFEQNLANKGDEIPAKISEHAYDEP